MREILLVLKERIRPNELKKIGNWGERFVLKSLKERFNTDVEVEETNLVFKAVYEKGDITEVKWLNKNKDVGKGYDFVIISDGDEIEYIEVKSKKGEAEELIEITGTQWEFARKLFNNGEGNKYKIYIVNNVGSDRANIKILKNPTKLWKDGKLYAHPVHFKI